jgi:hypothetical protein
MNHSSATWRVDVTPGDGCLLNLKVKIVILVMMGDESRVDVSSGDGCLLNPKVKIVIQGMHSSIGNIL